MNIEAVSFPTRLEQLHTDYRASLLFECVAGSRAYGTSTATSDEDLRGIFAVPAAAYLDLERPPDQVGDERGNIVHYSLRRVVELLAQANPNILELLFMPQDCVLAMTPEMQSLMASRDLFISKQCADAHAGYAMSQIRKAKGQNKWVNNPRPPAPPEKGGLLLHRSLGARAVGRHAATSPSRCAQGHRLVARRVPRCTSRTRTRHVPVVPI